MRQFDDAHTQAGFGLTIRSRGGAVLCVPRSASYLSTYVLLEQEDWFEKEIGFVRRVLQPGMRAIDVGANFGCYSVAMARAVGRDGALWLYEPTASTYDHLRRTLDLNELGWVHALKAALSDHCGTGILSVGENSELNSLGRLTGASDKKEAVELTTLDRSRAAASIAGIDFVKLDAEGEEVRILAGGREFFRAEDPLVMFEVKHGNETNFDLPRTFEQLGYRLYRLIGPDSVLVPVAAGEPLDDYELNLFACKPGRASRLAASGQLIEAAASPPEVRLDDGIELWRRQAFAAAFGPNVALRDPLYARALANYATWRDTARPLEARYAALWASRHDLLELALRAPTLPRLFTLVRVAREVGSRALAVHGLQRIVQALGEGRHDLDEPCWPALERFDELNATGSLGTWLTASAVEATVISNTFSGYFSGPTALPMLDWLHGTVYASAPMERRRELQAIFAGRQQQVEGSALLLQASPANLNPELWTAGSLIPRGVA